MEYLLDTDHLSYLQEQNPKVLRRLAALHPSDLLATSAVNLGELLRGTYLLPESRKRRHLLALFHHAISQLAEIAPVTRAVAERYAEIDAALTRKGKPIPVNDVWVAAVAITRGAVLVTNDRHFSHVDGLTIRNWTR